MQTTKKILFLLPLLAASISIFSQTLNSDSVASPEIPEGAVFVDLAKVACFLDEKRVTEIDNRIGAFKSGAMQPQDAIFRYGEIARLGIIIFESKNKEDQFVLQGAIEDKFNGSPIMLFTFKGDSVNSVDTTIVRNGAFTFKGKEYLSEEAIITTGNYPDEVKSGYVILERGNIQISLLDSLSNVAFGTPLNDIMLAYDSAMTYYNRKSEKRDFDLTAGLITEKEASSLKTSNIEEKYRTRSTFIKDNISNLAGKIILKRILPNNILAFSDFDELYALMSDELKSDPTIAKAVKFRDEYIKKELDRERFIGKQYIDFEFETPEGERKNLSDYIGKSEYILLDFWASWCAPCIKEIPNLKKIYDKYTRNQLDIIGISLDENRPPWLKIMEKVDAPWIHLRGYKETLPELKKKYHLMGIPFTILLDKEGVIRDVNSDLLTWHRL